MLAQGKTLVTVRRHLMTGWRAARHAEAEGGTIRKLGALLLDMRSKGSLSFHV